MDFLKDKFLRVLILAPPYVKVGELSPPLLRTSMMMALYILYRLNFNYVRHTHLN